MCHKAWAVAADGLQTLAVHGYFLFTHNTVPLLWCTFPRLQEMGRQIVPVHNVVHEVSSMGRWRCRGCRCLASLKQSLGKHASELSMARFGLVHMVVPDVRVDDAEADERVEDAHDEVLGAYVTKIGTCSLRNLFVTQKKEIRPRFIFLILFINLIEDVNGRMGQVLGVELVHDLWSTNGFKLLPNLAGNLKK